MADVSVAPSPSEIIKYKLSYGDSFKEQIAELEKGETSAFIRIMKQIMNLEDIPKPANARTLSTIQDIVILKLIFPEYKKAILYQIDSSEQLISILDVVNAIAV